MLSHLINCAENLKMIDSINEFLNIFKSIKEQELLKYKKVKS